MLQRMTQRGWCEHVYREGCSEEPHDADVSRAILLSTELDLCRVLATKRVNWRGAAAGLA